MLTSAQDTLFGTSAQQHFYISSSVDALNV